MAQFSLFHADAPAPPPKPKLVEDDGLHPMLRPYQREAVESVLDDFKTSHSALVVMATGLGKTFTASEIIRQRLKHGRALFIAHRYELIHQAARAITNLCKTDVAIEMADEWADVHESYRSPVVVASVQTLNAGQSGDGRMVRFDPDDFATVIIDESHHAVAPTYKRVVEHFRQNDDLKILGITATPDRADEEALGQIFDTVSYTYEIDAGQQDGWLVPIVQSQIHIDHLDLSGVRTTAGDLNGKDLAAVMEYEQCLHEIAWPLVDHVGDRKTLVFAASVAHAERLAEIVNRHKPGAASWVCGKTPADKRENVFRQFAEGRTQYLINVGITTEGWDEPSVEVVAIARPTKSRALYTQMVGRGTRALPGVLDGRDEALDRRLAIVDSAKPQLEVMDFVGNSGKHKLITTADILGGNYPDEVIERAKKDMADQAQRGKPVDTATALQKAEADLKRERAEREERARRQKLRVKAKYRVGQTSPFDVLDIQPAAERGWDKANPLTDKQKAVLEKNGIKVEGLSRKHASQLIGKLFGRREHGYATYKQLNVLIRAGYKPSEVKALKFDQASQWIDKVAKNGWRKPTDGGQW